MGAEIRHLQRVSSAGRKVQLGFSTRAEEPPLGRKTLVRQFLIDFGSERGHWPSGDERGPRSDRSSAEQRETTERSEVNPSRSAKD